MNKQDIDSVASSKTDRRGFLRQLGIVGAALPLAPAAMAAGIPRRLAESLSLTANGTVDLAYVVFNPNNPPTIPPLPPVLEVRGRFQFPYMDRDILETFVYVAPVGAPDTVVSPVSLFYSRIDHAQVAMPRSPGDLYSLALLGSVIANPVTSPFGELAGLPTAVSCGFDQPGTATTFELMGGPVAGNHATFLPLAQGSCEIKRPFQSY